MKAELVYWDDTQTIEVLLEPENLAEKCLVSALQEREPGKPVLNGEHLEIPFRRKRKKQSAKI